MEKIEKVRELIELMEVDDIGEFSDGYHTFNELYYHRMVLFAALINLFPERAWKAKKHDDGTMYDDMFIVGINTDWGQATYHYDLRFWHWFECQNLESAPEFDGHTPEDALQRIYDLSSVARYTERSKLLEL